MKLFSKVSLAIAEGAIASVTGAVLLWLTLPAGTMGRHEPSASGLFRDDFACRWDGGCLGWTREVAVLHLVGDLATWSAYVVIAVVIIKLHPILARVRYSRLTVPLMTLVFVTCGGVHLLDAYATFRPMYVALGWYKNLAGLVGIAGAVLIAHNLVSAFDIVLREQRELATARAKQR